MPVPLGAAAAPGGGEGRGEQRGAKQGENCLVKSKKENQPTNCTVTFFLKKKVNLQFYHLLGKLETGTLNVPWRPCNQKVK